MNLIRSGTKVTAARFTETGVLFLGVTVFARTLDADAMGVFFLFEAVLTVLSIPADVGIRRAVEKQISDSSDAGAVLGSAVMLKTVPLLLIIPLILTVSGPVNSYFGSQVAGYLAVGLVLREAALLSVSVIKGELRVGATALLRVVKRVVWVAVSGVFVFYGYGEIGLVYGVLAGYAAMFLLGVVRRMTSVGRPEKETALSLIEYGKSIFVTSIGGKLYTRADVLMIGFFLTPAAAGTYEIAWRVASTFRVVSGSIGGTIFPQVSAWDAEGELDPIEKLIPKAITPSLMLAIPAFFGSVLFSEEILGVVFGTEYAVASVVLVVLMADTIPQSIQVIVGNTLQAIDRPDLAARASIISTGVNIALNLVLIWQFGIIGAAVATGIASLVNDLLHYYYLSDQIYVRLPWRATAIFVTGSVAMSAVLLTATTQLDPDSLPTLFFLIALGGIAYFSLIALSPTVREMMQRFYASIV